jgi:MoaA/NifB/PqqE/SkfB family radical SAM enzyme
MEEIIKRMLLWKKGQKAGPISIHLDLSNRCNLKCKFCWQRSHERIGLVDIKNEISEERLLKLVREAYELGVKEWLLSGGGEPMLRTETCIKVMKEIKKYNMHGDIITNGCFLNEENIKELLQIGWDRIRFSIDGSTKEIHDSIVSKEGTFNRVIKNIELINKYKRIYRKQNPEIGFNTVINSHNYKDFPYIVALLKRLNGCLLNVQNVILYSDEEKIYALNKEQIKESYGYLKKALDLANRYKIHTNLSSYINQEILDKSNKVSKMDKIIMDKLKSQDSFINIPCYEPWYLMTIRANGIIGSCRLFGDSGVELTDQSLQEIWQGSYFNDARKKLLTGKLADYCKKCGANEIFENVKIREGLKNARG